VHIRIFKSSASGREQQMQQHRVVDRGATHRSNRPDNPAPATSPVIPLGSAAT
jgi:hypothetical protein